jgi:hypothetical protein
MNYTSTGLVSQIKRRALIPTSQNLFSDSDLIEILNEELQNRIIPYILSVREDYYLTYDEFTCDGTDTEYDIPTKAIGNKINQITLYTSNTDDSYFGKIPRLTAGQIDDVFGGYYLESNKIKLYPSAINSGTLRIYYYRRPSEIVATTRVSSVTLVTTNTSITIQTVPSGLTTGTNIDIVNYNQPWDTKKEVTAGTVVGSVIDLSDTSDILVGDYVCFRNESPFAQIPQDTIPLLIQAVVTRILEYMGDANGMQAAMLTYAQMESDNRALLSPRVDSQPKKIRAKNKLHSYLWR